MNFLAHGMLAMEHLACPVGALTSMAEDLAPLAGLHLRRDGVGPVLRRGIDHHRRVDAAFHDADEFRASCRELAAALRDAGEGRWAATATAHVAVELLIDGSIPAADSAALWSAVLDPVGVRLVGGLFAAPDRAHWEAVTEQWRDAGPPRYDSVPEVARRSVGAVSRRGRLRPVLSHEQVATVVERTVPLNRHATNWTTWKEALSAPGLAGSVDRHPPPITAARLPHSGR